MGRCYWTTELPLGQPQVEACWMLVYEVNDDRISMCLMMFNNSAAIELIRSWMGGA